MQETQSEKGLTVTELALDEDMRRRIADDLGIGDASRIPEAIVIHGVPSRGNPRDVGSERWHLIVD